MAPGKATCISICKSQAFQVVTSAPWVIRRNSKLLDLIMSSRVTSGLSITHYKNKSVTSLFIRCLQGCEATAAQGRCQELLSSRQFLISHPLLTPNIGINYGWRYVNTKPLPVSGKCDRDISARPGLALRSSLPGRRYRSNGRKKNEDAWGHEQAQVPAACPGACCLPGARAGWWGLGGGVRGGRGRGACEKCGLRLEAQVSLGRFKDAVWKAPALTRAGSRALSPHSFSG